MLRVGQKEIDAVAKLMHSGKLFRYHKGQCDRFERRYAKHLGVKHVCMTSSGTSALTAALVGLEIGPGQEVIVPAHTYMATAVAVLAAGAIPVIVDVDDSITIDPEALDDAIGPRTTAVMPVHMWGLVCNMKAIMRIARRRKLKVVEDCSQCVGGAYEGKKVGTFGHAAGFSFNFYKNMTCGEGGAVVTKTAAAMRRAQCIIDCCDFYWTGRDKNFHGFTSNGARASEIEGAIMNAQLDRLPAMINTLRRQKKRILRETANTALTPSPCHSLDHECGTKLFFKFASARAAQRFAAAVGGRITGQTGRHTYNEWTPILQNHGAHDPALDPFRLPQNKGCRMKYSADMLPKSLDILNRTAMIATTLDATAADVATLIRKIKTAAAAH